MNFYVQKSKLSTLVCFSIASQAALAGSVTDKQGITESVQTEIRDLEIGAHPTSRINEMERIVVTATGYEQRLIDAPASISVIFQDELRKKSYSTIVDAVRDIPGVYISGGGNMQDISIRGMDDQYTLYLVDGRPLSAGRSVNTNGADGENKSVCPR
nr:TonB-dependent receptor plug domain-containing protein [Ningiella sp. W23]